MQFCCIYVVNMMTAIFVRSLLRQRSSIEMQHGGWSQVDSGEERHVQIDYSIVRHECLSIYCLSAGAKYKRLKYIFLFIRQLMARKRKIIINILSGEYHIGFFLNKSKCICRCWPIVQRRYDWIRWHHFNHYGLLLSSWPIPVFIFHKVF